MVNSKGIFDCIVIGGGQSGLASAYHLQKEKLNFVILEAGATTSGSWTDYYDSLVLFSPARYSSLPGFRFPGDLDRYPSKAEVIEYLQQYADYFSFPIELLTVVERVTLEKSVFNIYTSEGTVYQSKSVIAATGSFRSPYIPQIEGIDLFKGKYIHVKEYKNVLPYTGMRVVVVGAGNSAVQIAYELSKVANVSLAARTPVKFAKQRLLGKDLHFWLKLSGFDRLPLGKYFGEPKVRSVLDDGMYVEAISKGQFEQREMFKRFTEQGVVWGNGEHEKIDAVIFATGYKPQYKYLDQLGPEFKMGKRPSQKGGISQTVQGLYFVGLSWQYAHDSATLRGVGADARYVVKHLNRHLHSYQRGLQDD